LTGKHIKANATIPQAVLIDKAFMLVLLCAAFMRV
jgi:hypothetical protein